ncbi:hypothetical protein MCAP1_002930 [Malassezia caprae]|uniref:Arrestin-like N-terminal domain-containing protein n=1 Tax=Malassezia caprae TaxID=1381934 RepID=A0AAF0IWC8_9BASI|nr:hypothetical protein MCAP1_002930 [Malassezia caprae]
MLSTIFQPCEIQVNLIQNVFFLRPPQRPAMDHENRTHDLPPLSNDELVRGIIHLNVPSERHIDGIRVHLRATISQAILETTQYNHTPSSYENSTFMERVLEIGVPLRLSKLQHHRSSSHSMSRPRSPSVTPGGGARHGDSSNDIFRNMVRGVSRGRHANRSQSQAGSLLRGRSLLPTDDGSRSHSRTRTPIDEAGSGSSTPHRRSNADLSAEDLQHLQRRLEQQQIQEEEDEQRGRTAERGTRSSLHQSQSLLENNFEVFRQEGEDGLFLEKGVHMFEFAFIIPADAPPYDRSPFGKVRYTVKVTALGAGRARGHVEEWRDFFPMVNPAPDGGVTPLTVLFNDVHDTVGMLSVACTSNNISVGGLFNIDIHSPSAPPDLLVYMVRISLHTTIELFTKRKGRQVTPVQKRKLFEKGCVAPQDKVLSEEADHLPGYIHYAGSTSAWTVQGVARIPDDNAIRPSTMPGTRSPLRFHHVLVVEVVHSRSDPSVPDALTPEGRRKLKVFTLRQSIVIPSCCCALDAVTLPAYSATPTSASSVPQLKHLTGTTWEQIVMANQDRGESHNMCVCGMSLADLSAAEQALLPPTDTTTLMVEHGRPGHKPGELDDTFFASSEHRPVYGAEASSSAQPLPADHPGPSRPPSVRCDTRASPSSWLERTRSTPAPPPMLGLSAPLLPITPDEQPPAYTM